MVLTGGNRCTEWGRGIQLPRCRPQIQYGRTWDGKELKGYSPAANPLYV